MNKKKIIQNLADSVANQRTEIELLNTRLDGMEVEYRKLKKCFMDFAGFMIGRVLIANMNRSNELVYDRDNCKEFMNSLAVLRGEKPNEN